MDLDMFIDNLFDFFELNNTNEKYTFYYNEINNPIKYIKTDRKIGIEDINKNYCIGGIVFREKAFDHIEYLIDSLNIQYDLNNNFIECLKSKKVNKILKWFDENNLFIHVFIFNNIFELVVEIVDSILYVKLCKELFYDINAIKSSFYNFILNHWDEFYKILIKYNYPNIVEVNSFCKELISLIEFSKSDDYFLTLCLDILKKGVEQKNLVIFNDKKYENLMDIYTRINFERINTFPNSIHYFNDVTLIKDKLNAYKNSNLNFKFIDLKKDYYIHLSDVIINIAYSYYSFLSLDTEKVKNEIRKLDEVSKENLRLIIKVIDKSHDENRKFIVRHESDEIIERQNSNYYLIKDILGTNVLRKKY